MSWKIYHKDGSVLTDVNDEQITVHGLEYSDKWMEECFVTIDFKHEAPINFAIGDYLIYRNGERFELNYDPGKQKQARVNTYGEGFVYEGVKFNSLQDELARTDFIDVVLNDNQLHYTSMPKFQFYVETIDDLLDRIQANLDEQIGKGMWQIFSRSLKRSIQRGVTEEEWEAVYGDEETSTGDFDSQSITVDSQTCWEALALANSKWDINFVVRNRNVYVGTAGKLTKGIFKYGLGNGLYEIEQNADSDQSIITRLRAYGSEKNLPSHYYADLGSTPFLNVTGDYHAGSTDRGLSVMLEDSEYDGMWTNVKSDNGSNIKHVLVSCEIDGYKFDAELELVKGQSPSCTTRLLVDNNKTISDAVKAKIDAGFKQIIFLSGAKITKFNSDRINYIKNLPNNMSINRLMLPGFPTMSLKEFWDSLTDEEKKYVNPTGRDHIFSTDKYRPYIDSVNIEKIGLRSGSQFFETDDKANGVIDIYPTIEEMVVGGVRIDEIYTGSSIDDNGRFDDGETSSIKNFDIYLNPTIDFDINDLRDDDFSISMKDGMCGGRSFKVASATKIEGMWRLSLERAKDDALGLYFPYNDYPIKKGDHFVLTGIELPESYIKAAALKLLKYAIALLDKNDYTRYVYQPKVDEIFMARQHDEAMADKTGAIVSYHDTLKAGDIMQFEDNDLGIDAQITIDQLTIKEEDGKIPTYEITLREDKEVGTIEKIQQQISSLSSGNGGSGGGGATMSQVKSVVASEGSKYFLSKLSDDVANGFITFAKGLAIGAKKAYKILSDGAAYLRSLNLGEGLVVDGDSQLGKNGTSTTFGDFHADSTGARIAVNEDGTSTAEFDFITIRRAAEFREITIRELKHIGGELAISAAAMVCSKVEPLDDNGNAVTDENAKIKAYKCYFDTSDSENGKQKVFQQFMVGDQARCQQFDIESVGETKKTRYYWRLVTEIGEDYIVLSDVDKDKLSTTEPQAGDNIVQLGYRYDDKPNRQSAMIFSATAGDAPSAKYYQGINNYSLNHIIKDEGYDDIKGTFHANVYGDSYMGDKDGNGYFSYDATSKTATFKGVAQFLSGSLLPDGETKLEAVTTKKDLENLNVRSGNLLRNTAFSGDYESADISESSEISEDKEMFSEKLKFWDIDGTVSIVDAEESMSGKAVGISSGGSLTQDFPQSLLDGEPYTLSFKAKGGVVTFTMGDSQKLTQELTAEYRRYELHFTNKGSSNDYILIESDNATLCEIMLTYGTIAPAWSPAYADNDKSVAQFQNMKFLLDAITQGSTTVDGGLVMSQMFRVGNYRDGKMTQETGGMSGYYNDDNSPYLWGGGSLEQAIHTIQRYKDNPTYQPSAEELEAMAKFVVTHGGRAILNDIILRGIIYAEGGVMKSIKSPNGNFEIDEEGNARLKGEIETSEGMIGGFKINSASIGTAVVKKDDGNNDGKYGIEQGEENKMSLNDEFIVFNGKDKQSILGQWKNYGTPLMMRMYDNVNELLPHYGAIISIYNKLGPACALSFGGGYTSGLALKTDVYHAGKTISRETNVAILMDTDCTYQLPDMQAYDDGHLLMLKRVNGGDKDNSVTIKVGKFYNSDDEEKTPYILHDHGQQSESLVLGSSCDAMTLIFSTKMATDEYTGCWLEFKNPRDW